MVGVFGSSRPLLMIFLGQTLACEGLACEGLSRSSRGLRTRLGVERDGAARLNAVCSPSGASLYPHSRHELLRLGTSRGQECPQPEQHTSHVQSRRRAIAASEPRDDSRAVISQRPHPFAGAGDGHAALSE